MHRPTRRRACARGTRPCPLGKVRYPDHKAAVAALHTADRSRRHADDTGRATRRREVRTYWCSACKGHHLTSQREQVAA